MLLYNQGMRALAMALVVALGGSACKSVDAGQVAAAAITVSAAVAAAAINRAATDECWGRCPAGSMCDGDSGLCVPLDEYVADERRGDARWYACDPDRFRCEADEWLVCDEAQCDWYRCVGDEEDCDLSREASCSAGESCAAELQGRVASSGPTRPLAPLADPCRGLCVSGEQCVVRGGVADCVAP